MYIYKNIVCLYNNEQTDDQNTDYKNFINTYIPNYTFDTSFPNNQTIFVLSNNVITSVFKLDMYLNIICVTNVYVNNDYYRTVDDANKTYQQITDVIITNIVSTLQSSKLTYDIAKVSNLSPNTIIISGFCLSKTDNSFLIKLNAILELLLLEVLPI